MILYREGRGRRSGMRGVGGGARVRERGGGKAEGSAIAGRKRNDE